MSDWKPIDTAPRYTDVIVYCKDTGEQMVAFWNGNNWQFAVSSEGQVIACKPSHWQPTLEPPNA